MATSALMTDTSRKTTLKRVLCIWYLVEFRQKNDKDENKDMSALIDLGNKVNAIHSAYATKLGLRARKIDLNTKKIDGSYLDIFKIIIVDSLVKHKLGTVQFFQETFLLANICLEVVLGIPLLTLSKEDIRFVERELVWRTYTAVEALPTTRRVEIINKREFTVAVLNADNKTFVVHVAALEKPTTILIYHFC